MCHLLIRIFERKKPRILMSPHQPSHNPSPSPTSSTDALESNSHWTKKQVGNPPESFEYVASALHLSVSLAVVVSSYTHQRKNGGIATTHTQQAIPRVDKTQTNPSKSTHKYSDSHPPPSTPSSPLAPQTRIYRLRSTRRNPDPKPTRGRHGFEPRFLPL